MDESREGSSNQEEASRLKVAEREKKRRYRQKETEKKKKQVKVVQKKRRSREKIAGEKSVEGGMLVHWKGRDNTGGEKH